MVKKTNYREILLKANEIDPGNSFVNSCAMYYVRNKKLTKDQIKSLKKVKNYKQDYEYPLSYSDLFEW